MKESIAKVFFSNKDYQKRFSNLLNTFMILESVKEADILNLGESYQNNAKYANFFKLNTSSPDVHFNLVVSALNFLIWMNDESFPLQRKVFKSLKGVMVPVRPRTHSWLLKYKEWEDEEFIYISMTDSFHYEAASMALNNCLMQRATVDLTIPNKERFLLYSKEKQKIYAVLCVFGLVNKFSLYKEGNRQFSEVESRRIFDKVMAKTKNPSEEYTQILTKDDFVNACEEEYKIAQDLMNSERLKISGQLIPPEISNKLFCFNIRED